MAEPAPSGSPIASVVILFAMEAEAAPLVEQWGLKPSPDLLPGPLPCVCYAGEVSGVRVTVVTNGKCPRFGVDCVGTVPAALAAYAALSALRPDLLLNAGTAGGFRARGGAVGDVYISSASRHHDRRIEIPVFDAYGVWEAQAAPAAKLAQALGFKLGLVSSGNSLNCSEQEREALDACGAHVKEMECASIAIVAAFFKTPFFAVKAITDIVDGDRVSADEFGENLAAAAAALGAALPRVIAHVAGKAVEDLA